MRAPRAFKFISLTALALLLVLGSLHVWVGARARLTPPSIANPQGEPTHPSATLRRFGGSYALGRGKILEVGLSGKPEQIGFQHARLLYPEMVENEGILLSRFEQQVSNSVFRHVLLDLAELRYAHVDSGMSLARRTEIAAGARGFQPDPYARIFPTYQRFVYLNALYDMALSFEHSPLIGCTTLTFGGAEIEGGGGILARAFDFEVDEVFDRHKAVFFVREDGQIPFASVAWPGLVGVVSGMNAEGLALVVHGARGGTPQARGEPVVHALRRVLSTARSTDEALSALAEQPAMVSHIVILNDEAGRAAVVERVPGLPNFVRFLPPKAVTTNHFEGPSAHDQKNLTVRAKTSTLPRRARGDELLARLPDRVTAREAVEDAVSLLRDRQGLGDAKLALGDRSAINALIATHGVVMDTKRRILWVSESPHLLGRFVAFDLKRAFSPDYDPEHAPELDSIAEDPLLTSGDYARWRSAQP
ncbi:MAG TPA: C45 family peptidase [Polyangiaceae bacterium]|jgi:isopenicillin-N N-acyltransferase-like protein|nr:C45 family peptidase [Polyangiaceae bacterium]